ncbi:MULTISPECIES: hypothetical protein [Halorussus]|uniref:hypothetical protein n=1 Tax=Halorussus TaxID=1070314 RepID=UPI00209CE757|nr:hypothetical protein [Halorussus vallis]USZ75684.1 hypothetical protein NGM07_19925 [Halorussus vallis]USZ75759.1 hypothetical protein NGM07_00160 [Halorussus vallis]
MEGRPVNAQTASELRRLARGRSYAAFKSAALACGMQEAEAELVWHHDGQPSRGEPVLAVRESGAELRGEGAAWLTSTAVARVER